MAESIIGLFKTEGINFLGPWKSVGQAEWETLKWVDWYNNTRLHSAIGYVTPQEAEEAFYDSLNEDEKAAQLLKQTLSGKTGAVQPASPKIISHLVPTLPPVKLKAWICSADVSIQWRLRNEEQRR